MQIGIVGLGRMGGNIGRRLLRRGHGCVVFDSDPGPGQRLAAEGAVAAADLATLVSGLRPPRHIWLMLPAGDVTEATFDTLLPRLSPGDLIVDGGNTHWKDDLARAPRAAAAQVRYVDVGVSGGVWGLERGYCLMVGGEPCDVARLADIFLDLAPEVDDEAVTSPDAPRPGYVHAGPLGAGHFAKMVHNGIEYGMMQALAEGLDVLKHAGSEALPADERLSIDTGAVAQAWRRGSVIQSWLLDLAAAALAGDPELSRYEGYVADSGEGRWTVEAAMAEAVGADVLTSAVFARFRSRQTHTFGEKILSAMRDGFGAHKEPAGSLS